MAAIFNDPEYQRRFQLIWFDYQPKHRSHQAYWDDWPYVTAMDAHYLLYQPKHRAG